MQYLKLSSVAAAVSFSLTVCTMADAQEVAKAGTQTSQQASSADTKQTLQEKRQDALELIQIFGDQSALDTAVGSANIVSQDTLQQFEFDDIYRVLQTTPGVYVREEDGYGLRPNIGLRGATSERSSKIALLEDGILIAPAPYSAPAAYFFPLVSRMQKVEVFKGPSAISFGPNTVGGAINMVSTSIGEAGSGNIDVAIGEQNYRKLLGNYSQSIAGLDVLVEGVHIAADGFKDLASGDDTGFEKTELLSKVAYDFTHNGKFHRLLAKVSYADEVSDETYLGLSDNDFAIDPYQRYAASSADKLDWEHLHMSLSHYVELSADSILYTEAYRRDFNRDWDRLDRFEGSRPIASILNSPDTGLNALFMGVLTGQRDSLTSDETLAQTLNDRTYYSQGVQSKYITDVNFDSVDMQLEAGVRLHQDQVERHHRDRFYLMRSGQLVRAEQNDNTTIRNKDSVTAIAAYFDTQWQWEKLSASAGARLEYIDGEAVDTLHSSLVNSDDTIVLPGAGVFYQYSEELGFLIGVNKGFVPNSPGQTTDIAAEESWNYEMGLRATYSGLKIDAIGFFNDYSNLKGTCTFSSGCLETLDQDFNGGEVDVYGLELLLDKTVNITDIISIPMTLAYTHTQAEFQSAFESSFAQWGDVQVGDQLPYIPENQIGAQIGLAGLNWHVALQYKYVSEMLEAAGTGTELEGLMTDELSQFDLSAWYQFDNKIRVYGKIDNLTDELSLVSRRPFGARPNKPRQLIVGVKYDF